MRLDKYISNSLLVPRSQINVFLKKNEVCVNGKRVNKKDFKIDEDKDIITVNNEKIEYKEFVYYMLNKPAGYVSAVKDNLDKTVVEIIDTHYDIFPIGRLDKDTEGLLILTNDGDLTYKLTHPKHEVDKTYMAIVKGIPTKEELKNFEEGLYIEDYKTAPAKIKIVKVNEETAYIGLTDMAVLVASIDALFSIVLTF